MLTMSARDRRGQRQEKEGCGDDRSMFDVERGPCSLAHPDWKPQDGPEQVSFTVISCVLPKADLLRGNVLEASIWLPWGDSGG